MRAKGSSEGSVFKTNDGYGIRWPENGKRPQKTGFRTKTEARRWFAENVAPRLGRSGPSNEITYDVFCEIFLARHGATIADSTRVTLADRLAHSRKRFGDWTLRRTRGRIRRRCRLAGRIRRRAAVPRHLRDATGALSRGSVEVPRPQPRRRRREEPTAASGGDHALHRRRGRRDRAGA